MTPAPRKKLVRTVVIVATNPPIAAPLTYVSLKRATWFWIRARGLRSSRCLRVETVARLRRDASLVDEGEVSGMNPQT
jgi:hypothetical protein